MLIDITLTKKTHDRLVDIALPLECADSVVSRLIDYFSVKTTDQKEISFQLPPTVFPLKREPLKINPRGGHPGPKVRDFNQDILANYLRGPYAGVTYRLACYDLLSRYSRAKPIPWIITRLFKFPFDNMRETRIKRAANSLKIALKEYTLKIGQDKLFTEPKPWHFTINPDAVTPAPESGNK